MPTRQNAHRFPSKTLATHAVFVAGLVLRADLDPTDDSIEVHRQSDSGAWILAGAGVWSGSGIRGFDGELGRGPADLEEALLALDDALVRAVADALLRPSRRVPRRDVVEVDGETRGHLERLQRRRRAFDELRHMVRLQRLGDRSTADVDVQDAARRALAAGVNAADVAAALAARVSVVDTPKARVA